MMRSSDISNNQCSTVNFIRIKTGIRQPPAQDMVIPRGQPVFQLQKALNILGDNVKDVVSRNIAVIEGT